MKNADKPSYIARCPKCNGIVMALINDGQYSKEEVSQWVANAIREGYQVNREKVTDVRSGKWCSCDSNPSNNHGKSNKKIPSTQMTLL